MAHGLDRPIRLLPIFRERVWGRNDLAPWFPVTPRQGRIGEVWFTFEKNSTSLGRPLEEVLIDHPEILGSAGDPRRPWICPLLVKLLFTSEPLSVQVHPDDAYASEHHESLGKTEAWYVLEAEPESAVAVGLRETIDAQQFRRAAQSGEIETLLAWKKVKPGDVVFVPAGTVHAIGAGLAICEIQENSDITYRIYDYGRPRELHLNEGVAVAKLGPVRRQDEPLRLAARREQLHANEYFRIERLRPTRTLHIPGDLAYYLLLICVKGSGEIAGEPFQAGEAWMAPAGGSAIQIDGSDAEWILTYSAHQPAAGITL